MRQCPRAFCGGQILLSDGRLVCSLCGFVAFEPEPTLLEKLMSNASAVGERPEARRQEPKAAPAAVFARVMASIRKEAR
jgi:hypothetical protein